MTKRIALIYVYLFLFAFTLGLSFTLASQTQAEPECCVVTTCPPPNEFDISRQGHWVDLPKGGRECRQENNDPCDWTYLCPD